MSHLTSSIQRGLSLSTESGKLRSILDRSRRSFQLRDKASSRALLAEYLALDFGLIPVHVLRRDASMHFERVAGWLERSEVVQGNILSCYPAYHAY